MSPDRDPLWREQLELVQVPEGYWPNIYPLGINASRITFSDQQKRALNLVAALVASKRLLPGDTLGIVGGGVAGITAAAFAHQQALLPTVIEQHSAAMMIQQGSNRWLHPNVYDWPSASWRARGTRFPCMNWSAGAAGEVIATLRDEWQHLVQSGSVSWRPNTAVVSFRRDNAAWLLQDEAGNEHGPFKAVLLAVGFGEEIAYPSIDCKPYWHDDDVHQRARKAAQILVSGCGDGGLIDAFRVLSLDFRHANLHALAAAADTSQIREYLLNLEANRPQFPDGRDLTEAYLALDASTIDQAIAATLKPDAVLTLNGRADGPLSRASSILNRFLIARLMRLGRVKYLQADFEPSMIKPSGAEYFLDIDGVDHRFDQVIIRRGPRPAAIEAFPDIANPLALAKRFFAVYPYVVDRTRQRLWETVLPSYSLPAPILSAPAESLDPRLVEHIAERAQESFKLQLQRLGAAPIVTRQVTSNQIELVAEGQDRLLGKVSLTLESKSQALLRGFMNGSAVHIERVTLPAGAAMVDELSRVLRTISFLVGGSE